MRTSILLTSVLVALLGSSSAGQDLEHRLDAVREFQRFFRGFDETAQRVEAVHTLEGNECVPAALELVALLDHEELEVRNAAMEVLATYRQPETFRGLLAELPDMKRQDRRARVIEVLGQVGLAEAVPVLTEIALEDRRADAQVRYRIARALGAIGDEAAAPALEALLGDSEELVRLGAVDAVAALDLEGLAAEVIPLLQDSAWQVRSGALRALAVLRPQEAIGPVIDLMAEGGRLAEEAAETLFAITTLDFGNDSEAWRQQWERLQAIDWRIPTDAELAKARESRKRSDALYGKEGEEALSFGGIETTSRRVLFVIDVSGSMEERVVETERFGDGYRDFQKLTLVKAELARTIEGLGRDTAFDVVAFATEVDAWKDRLVPANVVNKASAKTWVRRLQPIGGSRAQDLARGGLVGSANLEAGKTNTYAALMYAFGVDPQRPARSGRPPLSNELDTVFFLSDGRPSTGRLVDTQEILAEVARRNEQHRIVFHAIAIGNFQKNFLRRLAQENGGQFVDLGR